MNKSSVQRKRGSVTLCEIDISGENVLQNRSRIQRYTIPQVTISTLSPFWIISYPDFPASLFYVSVSAGLFPTRARLNTADSCSCCNQTALVLQTHGWKCKSASENTRTVPHSLPKEGDENPCGWR